MDNFPPGTVFIHHGYDKCKWVITEGKRGHCDCRYLQTAGPPCCHASKETAQIIGRLPPDHLDATEWKEEYRLPKDYDPEKHDLWWVTHKRNRWMYTRSGRFGECPGWKLVEPARSSPQKAHPGDQIEELKKELDELSMIFTGQPYDENQKYERDDTFLVWRGWTVTCANPKRPLGEGPPPVAIKGGEEPITRDSIPAILDEIMKREMPSTILPSWATNIKDEGNGLISFEKTSRLPEIAKWIATIGALGAGIWSVV